ncbi:MAG TPA: hypothetical protein VFX16_31355 [Pseudonocardiaceae bacterium]|nr:hypothetical protein [Pseudonocardiaceae bacterium]
MTIVTADVPVTGLADLTNESRMIATPWSRMVRGIGLGQYPVDYDHLMAERIRATFDRLATKVPDADAYTAFSGLLADFILNVADPGAGLSRADMERALDRMWGALRAERNPYHRLTAGCILLDAFAKLDIDRGLLIDGETDVPAEILAILDQIEPDRIQDENHGRHGHYERLAASTAVFLAFGQLGIEDRLIGERNHVVAALHLLDKIPAPFFRGRGGSMLLSAICVLGYERFIFDGDRDYLQETLDYLDRADEVKNPPSFPQPMSDDFPKIYPLLTMLNAIAMSGRAQYLTYRRDRLAEARQLLTAITPVERTHMGLYYLVALYNLGRLREQVPDVDAFVDDVVGQWGQVDPGSDFFLNGIAYPYLIETAMVTGRTDLITDTMLDRLLDSFPDLDRTSEGQANRPYPLSYVVTMLGEIGVADRLFAPRARYGGMSPLNWAIDHLSADAVGEGSRLYMLDHAMVSYALRLRGANRKETELFRKFRFRLA